MGSHKLVQLALWDELTRNITFAKDLSTAYRNSADGVISDSAGLAKALKKSNDHCHETLGELLRSFVIPDYGNTDNASIPSESVTVNNSNWENVVHFTSDKGSTEKQIFDSPKNNSDGKKQQYQTLLGSQIPFPTQFQSPSKNFVQSCSRSRSPKILRYRSKSEIRSSSPYETFIGPQSNLKNKSPSKSRKQPRHATKKRWSTSETRNKSPYKSRNRSPYKSRDLSPNKNRKRSPRRSRHPSPYKRNSPFKRRNSSSYNRFYLSPCKLKNHRPSTSSSLLKFETRQLSPNSSDQEERNRKITRSIGRKLSKHRKNDIPSSPDTSTQDEDMHTEEVEEVKEAEETDETEDNPTTTVLPSSSTFYQGLNPFFHQSPCNFSPNVYYVQSPRPPAPYFMPPRSCLIPYTPYPRTYYTPTDHLL